MSIRRALVAFVVIAALATGVTAPSYATKFPIEGRRGDAAATDECRKGEYIVGLKSRSGAWIDQIEIVCAVLMKDMTLKVIHDMPKRGGEGGGPAAFDCGPYAVVNGWWFGFTEDRLQVKYIFAQCKNLVNGSVFGKHLAMASVPNIDNYDSGQNPKQYCPSGEIATGLATYYGAHVNALGLICGPLLPAGTGEPPPPITLPEPKVKFDVKPFQDNKVPAGNLFMLDSDGGLMMAANPSCANGKCTGWTRLDGNKATRYFASGGTSLYQMHQGGAIWHYTGKPCDAKGCPGWEQIDNNATSTAIAAGGSRFYQMHGDGSIWRYTGKACQANICAGWEKLDNNPATSQIIADGDDLYQRHTTGAIFKFTGRICTDNSCPGWQMLDNNPAARQIVASGGKLYQLHDKTGAIFRYTGQPCSGNSCPGWTMLDNNAGAYMIQASPSTVYQLRKDGTLLRFAGAACRGSSCTGWDVLDNNTATTQMVATSQGLYQLHGNSGVVWKSTGAPCGNTSCPGWQPLTIRAGMGIAGGQP